MKNYTLLRFVKLNLYFFVMYSLLTALWYGLSGKFAGAAGTVLQEIALNAAVFSLLFSVSILLWYRRTEFRIPVQKYKPEQLRQKIEEAGYLKVSGHKHAYEVYKPAPPKAPALAGKIFVQKTTNFYVLQGPTKYLKGINGKV